MNKLSKDSVRQADTFISVRDVRIAIHILFNMEFVSRFIEGSERGAEATLTCMSVLFGSVCQHMMQGCRHHPAFLYRPTINFLFAYKTIQCYSLEEEWQFRCWHPHKTGLAQTVQGPGWETEKYTTVGQLLNYYFFLNNNVFSIYVMIPSAGYIQLLIL